MGQHRPTPCQQGFTFNGVDLHPNDWIDENSPNHQFAQFACDHCPLQRQCAHQALTSGSTLDRNVLVPANGVVQAGVMCKGDERTLHELRTIAHTTDVIPLRWSKPKAPPPTNCLGCGKPMVVRPKGKKLDATLLTHAAHGYCRICDAKRRKSKHWVAPTPTQNQILG